MKIGDIVIADSVLGDIITDYKINGIYRGYVIAENQHFIRKIYNNSIIIHIKEEDIDKWSWSEETGYKKLVL
tara:strand:- start:175 stop:390 length:216 start_codon:yes stop_codon:yes gene_type:complete